MCACRQSQQPLKILIVEDNRDARTTLRMLLTIAYRHIVYEAGDGLRAIQTALEERTALALIDIGLPDIDTVTRWRGAFAQSSAESPISLRSPVMVTTRIARAPQQPGRRAIRLWPSKA